MSSKEIQKKFTEKYRNCWRKILANHDISMNEMEEIFDLFLDYGAQMFKDGLDKGEEIYNK
tara:strand:- start:211 stop:393 length:183 start_codon:yes stop_codon:yes gene_type:complete